MQSQHSMPPSCAHSEGCGSSSGQGSCQMPSQISHWSFKSLDPKPCCCCSRSQLGAGQKDPGQVPGSSAAAPHLEPNSHTPSSAWAAVPYTGPCSPRDPPASLSRAPEGIWGEWLVPRRLQAIPGQPQWDGGYPGCLQGGPERPRREWRAQAADAHASCWPSRYISRAA